MAAKSLRKFLGSIPAPHKGLRELPTLKKIPQEEWNDLSQKIVRARGKVVVLVHPFFEDIGPEYNKLAEKILLQRKTPVVILEPAFRVKETRQRLEKLGASNYLIIPTGAKSERIIRSTDFFDVSFGRGAEKKSAQLIERLAQAGAKNVILGGMYLDRIFESRVVDSLSGKELRAKVQRKPGCLGATYERVKGSKRFEKVVLMPKAHISTLDVSIKSVASKAPHRRRLFSFR